MAEVAARPTLSKAARDLLDGFLDTIFNQVMDYAIGNEEMLEDARSLDQLCLFCGIELRGRSHEEAAEAVIAGENVESRGTTP